MRPADPARPTDPLPALFLRARVHCQSVGDKAPCGVLAGRYHISSDLQNYVLYIKMNSSQTEGCFLAICQVITSTKNCSVLGGKLDCLQCLVNKTPSTSLCRGRDR